MFLSCKTVERKINRLFWLTDSIVHLKLRIRNKKQTLGLACSHLSSLWYMWPCCCMNIYRHWVTNGLILFILDSDFMTIKWATSHMLGLRYYYSKYLSRDMTKPTKWVCAQRRLRSAWASAQSDQSLHCPHEEKTGSLATHWAPSEDSDQAGRMPKLIWVFTGRTAILLVLSCRGLFYYLYTMSWHRETAISGLVYCKIRWQYSLKHAKNRMFWRVFTIKGSA